MRVPACEKSVQPICTRHRVSARPSVSHAGAPLLRGPHTLGFPAGKSGGDGDGADAVEEAEGDDGDHEFDVAELTPEVATEMADVREGVGGGWHSPRAR